MELLYSIRWEKSPMPWQPVYSPHLTCIRITFLNAQGDLVKVTKLYEEWLGVCTRHIDRVVHLIQQRFPACSVRYHYLQDTRKILPYFERRLQSGKLSSTPKPFYKVYVRGVAAVDVGKLFQKHKMSYYEKEDWLVRLYIDLGVRFQSRGFYYKWYTVDHSSDGLLDSLHMHPDRTTFPDWTLAAFDLETVPMDGGVRVPTGEDASDEIVMISLYKWNEREGCRKFLFYRVPCPLTQPIVMEDAWVYPSEAALLTAFHDHLQDCQVLTGYNINGFDFPCLFSRLTWLGLGSILKHYTSMNVGKHLITTFQNKLVLDLYPYVRSFSGYDVPSFKLDDVARTKLGEAKVSVNATGLWYWFTQSPPESLIHSDEVQECFDALKPSRLSLPQFGTFKQYMDYCFKDAWLVYQLFRKEMVLHFCVQRANFTAWDASHALYMGHSSYLLELFKTYGTLLGFFMNMAFMKSPVRMEKYESLFVTKGGQKRYQGALNYGMQGKHEDVSVMDFASMYPSTLVSSNLCYSTCTILTRDEWLTCPYDLTVIPYRTHGEEDFIRDREGTPTFLYPPFDPEQDAFAIVIDSSAVAFLPTFVKNFIELRKFHQASKDVFHYNAQLCIKLLINSLYGIMASKDSKLFYIPIALSITHLAREQLLGSYHYLKRLHYRTCYVDTDSLMVVSWPFDHCQSINTFLNIPHVELKYERRVKRLLILSRKRYVYETLEGDVVLKGFQKRSNELVDFLTHLVLINVWKTVFNISLKERPLDVPENSPSQTWCEEGLSLESQGWLLWCEIIQKSHYKARRVDKYSIYRKTKHLHEYKSKSCAAVRMLEKYPEKANDYIEYTYSRADVSKKEAAKWIMDVSECQQVNFHQLFKSQECIFLTLLNIAYWKRPKEPKQECEMMLNALRWKQFVHVELLHYFTTKRRIMMLVESGVRYTFCMNVHTSIKRSKGRQPKEE